MTMQNIQYEYFIQLKHTVFDLHLAGSFNDTAAFSAFKSFAHSFKVINTHTQVNTHKFMRYSESGIIIMNAGNSIFIFTERNEGSTSFGRYIINLFYFALTQLRRPSQYVVLGQIWRSLNVLIFRCDLQHRI